MEPLNATEDRPGVVARMALALTGWTERWLPDAFIFALVATVLAVLAAVTATDASILQVVDASGQGFWELIPFTLQMALIIITGHVLATLPPIGRGAGHVLRPDTSAGHENGDAPTLFMDRRIHFQGVIQHLSVDRSLE